MSRPVLVLVMSEKCGACQNFKRKALPELEKELRKNNSFDFQVLNFPEMQIPVRMSGLDYHPQLRNGIVEFFPTFILFPGNIWNDHTTELEGVPKHKMDKNPNIDYSKKSILNWIDETVQNNPVFNQNTKPIKKSGRTEYVVPTLGTYTRFHSTKPGRTE